MSLRLEQQTENVEGAWSLLDGPHLIACPGTFDGATVKLQLGIRLSDDSIVTCADITDLTFTAEPEPFVATFSGDGFVYRWVVESAGASTEVTPAAGRLLS